MNATCVIPSYQRRQNLPQIIDSLLDTPEISEVMIWNNDLSATMELTRMIVDRYREEPVHLAEDKDKRNLFTFGRFRAAMASQNRIVCTQDDDVLVHPDKWKKLFELFHSHNQERACVLMDKGHIGYGIKGRKYQHFYKYGEKRCVCWETLFGWGSVFLADWVREIFAEYFACQPSDELSYRKADRVFAVMLETEHVVVRDEIHHLSGATSAKALYRGPNHWSWNKEAIKRALNVLATRP